LSQSARPAENSQSRKPLSTAFAPVPPEPDQVHRKRPDQPRDHAACYGAKGRKSLTRHGLLWASLLNLPSADRKPSYSRAVLDVGILVHNKALHVWEAYVSVKLFARTSPECTHATREAAEPRAAACEECGSTFNLRVCTTCGHVGCCESQRGHNTAHARSSGHALIKSMPVGPGHFTWCYACNRYL
jgi:hypothetical protein